MSEKTIEWLAVVIFFTCFFAFTLLEASWLNKKSGSLLGKTVAFSFATNIFTVTIGFALSFVVYATVLMIVFGGPDQRLSGSNWRNWAAVLAGAVFSIVSSLLAKRLGLRIFKLGPAASPWIFSLAASVILLLVVTGAPILFIYLS